MLFYIVFRFFISKAGQESHSEQRYDDEIQARKRYYNILAGDIDSQNLQYEIVQVIRSTDGTALVSQVFDFSTQSEPNTAE